jgi:membrane protease YdiL (CAAX protease family)
MRAQASAVVWDLQARLIVGTAWLSQNQAAAAKDFGQIVDPTSMLDRCRLAVLKGELAGHQAAQAELAAIGQDFLGNPAVPRDGELVRLHGLLAALYDARGRGLEAVDELPAESQAFLAARLNWLGELALLPPGTVHEARRANLVSAARRTALTFILAGGALVIAGLCGLAFLAVWGYLVATRRWKWRHEVERRHGGLYAETFALWMLLFLLLSATIPAALPEGSRLMGAALASCASLSALLWPFMRGVPAGRLCADLGLAWPQSPWLEPLRACATYVAGVPVVALGLVVTLLLVGRQQQAVAAPLLAYADPPMHPILGPLVHASGWVRVQTVLVVLLVPVVEEVMFRGVLYRHLREATRGWGRALSVMASATASGTLFAAVHPQGWVAIPPLAAIGAVLAVEREWRGSLAAPIFTHMMVNGVTMAIVLVAAT